MKYYAIAEMIEAIDEPNRTACRKLYEENIELFKKAAGSSYNHQAWEGGYFDHITEVMNVCVMLYPMYNVRGLNFTLSDALLVMFIHDLEKAFSDEVVDVIEENYGTTGNFLSMKEAKAIVRNQLIEKYNIVLTEQQQNAFKYVEGENNDYSSGKRVMNELAAFCHIADVSSARIWHEYGKEKKW